MPAASTKDTKITPPQRDEATRAWAARVVAEAPELPPAAATTVAAMLVGGASA